MVTFKNEGGFADATRAVKDKRLRNAVVLSMIVEDSFEKGPWDYSPCLVHH